jgi:hypothetical protein
VQQDLKVQLEHLVPRALQGQLVQRERQVPQAQMVALPIITITKQRPQLQQATLAINI